MKFDIGVYQDRLSGQFKFERQLTILTLNTYTKRGSSEDPRG